MTTMNRIILSQKTKAAIDNLVAQAPQAVLLTGEAGSGKPTTALHIAQLLIGDTPQEGITVHTIVPDKKNTVSIDQVREIKQIVKLKLPKKSTRRSRIIIVHEAHAMRDEAQNALLKTLEEPPDDTTIILVSLSSKYLLPTVQSRVSQLHIQPLSLQEAHDSFVDAPQDIVKQSYYMSNGNAGLLKALVEGSTDHPLVATMKVAKQILTSSRYERLKTVDTVTDNTIQAQHVLYCMKRLLQHKVLLSHRQADIERLRLCIEAERDLENHVHNKLVFTDLLLKI